MPAPAASATTPQRSEATVPPAPQPRGRASAPVLPCLTVLGSAAAALAVAAITGYGVATGNGRRFLPNDRAPNAYEAHIAYTIEYATGSSEYNDVLLVGDSTCTCDLQPLELERLTGLRAYNAGTAGLVGVDGCEIILRAYLRHHPRPRLLVFCVTPWAMGVPPEDAGPEEIRQRFLWCYGPPGGAAGGPGAGVAVRRQEVRRGLSLLIGYLTGGDRRYFNEPIPGRGDRTYNNTRKELDARRGFEAAPGALPPDWRRPPGTRDPYPVLPQFEQRFGGLARLAREKGIPVLVRLAPVPPGARDEQYTQVRAWAARARGAGVVVGLPEVMVYDSPLFFDRIHCNPAGAGQFTTYVAEEVSRMLGEAR